MGVRARWTAALLAGALLAGGCGNRLSHEEVLAQNTVSGDAVGSRTPVTRSGGAAGATAAASTPGDEQPATGGTDAAAGGDPAAVIADPAGPGGGGEAPAAGAGAPIVIGMVGWLSGIGGQTSGFAREMTVAWQRHVNERGGINGHPVELLIGDDGGNESRSLSIVRDFVENRGAIAIVNYYGGSAVAVSEYARANNIPVIGGNIIEQLWTQNPMMFPHVAATEGHFWGSAQLAVDAGVRRVATVYCTEVAACQQSNDTFVRYAQEAGLEVVYQGRISFTQPDYTAECLQMRNAGAEAIVPITENSSAVRLAQSCGRQDFNPTHIPSVANDAMAGIPEFDGAIASLLAFPYFLRSGSPAIEEYAQVVQRYLPERAENGVDALANAWVAVKLFERAAQNVSAAPTSADILAGLWAMRGETLDGLLPGGSARTFIEGQPAAETFCVYAGRVAGGAWTAPNGPAPTCR